MGSGILWLFQILFGCLDYVCKLPLHFIAKVKVIIKKEVCTLQCIHHKYCFTFRCKCTIFLEETSMLFVFFRKIFLLYLKECIF